MLRQWWQIPTTRQRGSRLPSLGASGPESAPLRGLLLASFIAVLAGCAAVPPPTSQALEDRGYGPMIVTNRATEMGIASWYGPGFHGKLTANGERYDQNGLTAAHRTLPLGTWVNVRDLRTDRTVKVRVNDRGPYKKGRSIDLSYAAANALGIIERGTTPVEIELLSTDYTNWPTILYSIQIGAFSQRTVADRLGRSAADCGYRAYLKIVGGGSTLYGVRVGPFRERLEAKQTAQALERDGFDVQLVDEDPRTANYVMRNVRAANESPNQN